jgi:hypothetical protein
MPQPKNILSAIADALASPAPDSNLPLAGADAEISRLQHPKFEDSEIAARRRNIAAKKEAEEDSIRHAPTPTHAAYAAIAAKLKFELPEHLNEELAVLKGQWREAYAAAMAHTHLHIQSAWDAHLAEIEAAGGSLEQLRNLRIRTREEIADEYLRKMQSANRQCSIVMGKINALAGPVRADLADAIERYAFRIENADELAAHELELERGQSPIVKQLLRAVLDLRTTVLRLDPNSDDELSVADLCCPK